MAIRIVRLGAGRAANEGLRVGTVRRPPRGVAKADFSSGNWYDVWFPNLAPSAGTVKLALAAESQREWGAFVKRYRAEMASPENSRVLDLLAALSHASNFSVGCYCVEEKWCHLLCVTTRSLKIAVVSVEPVWLRWLKVLKRILVRCQNWLLRVVHW